MRMTYSRFQKIIWEYYCTRPRLLPWRQTRDPYRILVSEVMLQQTQVECVLKKYSQFIQRFPSFKALAEVPLREVLKVWQGMGYNRRAQYIRQIAAKVITEYSGRLPNHVAELKLFPGIGDATAGAVVAFTFNKPVVFIETNIRTVFIHHFFKDREQVYDKEISPLVKKTLDRRNPREWYYALMDYGAMLKKLHGNPNRQSAHYAKQAPFKGSNREVRGAIVRLLTAAGKMNVRQVIKRVGREPEAIAYNLANLQKEGLLAREGDEVVMH